MEKIFEILKSIKKVETSENLYDKILKKIEQHKNSKINIVWVRIVAGVLLLMFSVEVFLIRNSLIEQEKTSLKSVLPTIDNMLYNE